MIGKWQKFRGLTSRQRREFLSGLALLPLAAAMLRLIGFPRLHRMIARKGPYTAPSWSIDSAALEDARSSARMVQAAARYGVLHGNCLSQSLTLWWILRRKKLAAELRLGARKGENGLDAHAWVELDGRIVNGSEDIPMFYAPFDSPAGETVAQRK